ncbi:MAG: response regulator transcription factor [Burkholderiales bacterium]|nr:response regulator transcription factor [Burkholderiales bacterium]
MKVFIAEDEPPARDRLVEALARVAPHARVAGTAESVRQARAWLAANPPPDLLLVDMQLADGLSLELFESAQLPCPTIFTTAYDEYAISAFEARAIDYLLKPVDEAKLARALGKLEQLRRHFSVPAVRSRVIARLGARHVVVPLERVAYFVSDDKLAFAVTWEGERHMLDEGLPAIEASLDAQRFLRLNRRYVVHAEAVASFVGAGKGRLSVVLTPPAHDEVIVSQERAGAVKAWLAR